MAEAIQYRFDFREAAIALLRQQGVTSGKWMISVEFKFTAGIVGAPDQLPGPSALLQISGIGLTSAADAPPDLAHLVVDASELAKG